MIDLALWRALHRWQSIDQIAWRVNKNRFAVWRILVKLHQSGHVRKKRAKVGKSWLYRRDDRYSAEIKCV